MPKLDEHYAEMAKYSPEAAAKLFSAADNVQCKEAAEPVAPAGDMEDLSQSSLYQSLNDAAWAMPGINAPLATPNGGMDPQSLSSIAAGRAGSTAVGSTDIDKGKATKSFGEMYGSLNPYLKYGLPIGATGLGAYFLLNQMNRRKGEKDDEEKYDSLKQANLPNVMGAAISGPKYGADAWSSVGTGASAMPAPAAPTGPATASAVKTAAYGVDHAQLIPSALYTGGIAGGGVGLGTGAARGRPLQGTAEGIGTGMGAGLGLLGGSYLGSNISDAQNDEKSILPLLTWLALATGGAGAGGAIGNKLTKMLTRAGEPAQDDEQQEKLSSVVSLMKSMTIMGKTRDEIADEVIKTGSVKALEEIVREESAPRGTPAPASTPVAGAGCPALYKEAATKPKHGVWKATDFSKGNPPTMQSPAVRSGYGMGGPGVGNSSPMPGPGPGPPPKQRVSVSEQVGRHLKQYLPTKAPHIMPKLSDMTGMFSMGNMPPVAYARRIGEELRNSSFNRIHDRKQGLIYSPTQTWADITGGKGANEARPDERGQRNTARAAELTSLIAGLGAGFAGKAPAGRSGASRFMNWMKGIGKTKGTKPIIPEIVSKPPPVPRLGTAARPRIVPERPILAKAAPGRTRRLGTAARPRIAPERPILAEAVPERPILAKAVPERPILAKAVPEKTRSPELFQYEHLAKAPQISAPSISFDSTAWRSRYPKLDRLSKGPAGATPPVSPSATLAPSVSPPLPARAHEAINRPLRRAMPIAESLPSRSPGTSKFEELVGRSAGAKPPFSAHGPAKPPIKSQVVPESPSQSLFAPGRTAGAADVIDPVAKANTAKKQLLRKAMAAGIAVPSTLAATSPLFPVWGDEHNLFTGPLNKYVAGATGKHIANYYNTGKFAGYGIPNADAALPEGVKPSELVRQAWGVSKANILRGTGLTSEELKKHPEIERRFFGKYTQEAKESTTDIKAMIRAHEDKTNYQLFDQAPGMMTPGDKSIADAYLKLHSDYVPFVDELAGQMIKAAAPGLHNAISRAGNMYAVDKSLASRIQQYKNMAISVILRQQQAIGSAGYAITTTEAVAAMPPAIAQRLHALAKIPGATKEMMQAKDPEAYAVYRSVRSKLEIDKLRKLLFQDRFEGY